MEKLDLTPDNLIRVGVTPELLIDAPAFFQWLESNQNTYIDIQNNCIYTDLVEPFNRDINLIRSFFENETKYKKFIAPLIEKSTLDFDGLLNQLPLENQKEFLVNAMPTLFDNVKKAKKVLYDIMLNEITGPKDLEAKEPEAKDINPFPLLFINFEVYKCFLEYTKKYIMNFYSDYSYLKKRLDHEKLIYYHKDTDFLNIIFDEMQLIKQFQYDSYFTKYDSKFKSLKSSYHEQRENNFNNVFEGLI